MSELPALETALVDAARRRYGRSWWRRPVPRTPRRVLAGLVVVAAVAGGVVVAAGLSGGSGPAGTDERPAGPSSPWTTTVNADAGYTISLPSGWALSAHTLTPHLSDPRERLSAGTFPLRFRQSACNHLPSGALRTMGPRDGFLTILERGRDPRSSWAEFPARPRHFADGARPQQRSDLDACLHGRPDLIEYWLPFSDAGRHFYAMIVLGSDAPPIIRTQAFGILDRLRFSPAALPDWQSTG